MFVCVSGCATYQIIPRKTSQTHRFAGGTVSIILTSVIGFLSLR
jgi:hypothetical protein